MACLALVALVAAVFWPVGGFRFIDYDDHDYVRDNAVVRRGLTVEGVRWAFTGTGSLSNWFPLTMLSYMLDVRLFGVRPGGHHLVNVLLHAAASALLLAVLLRMTGALWPATLVAALFAVHPLRVESVAWVAERKDVLSTLLGIAAIGAYVAYARRASFGRYLTLAVLFALGLTAKPMLVTLPFVLVLLDFWPLGRLRLEGPARAVARGVGRNLLEKAPLLLMAAASAALTFAFQLKGGAVVSLHRLPTGVRLANVPIAYLWYLGKTAWPARLALFHKYHYSSPPLWEIAAAVATLAVVTGAVIALARRFPFLPVGWLWYLGTLTPVIGLVQVGEQFVADRYSYLPSVGLLLALVWAARSVPARTPTAVACRAVAACAVVAVLAGLAHRQVWRWRDSGTLYAWALSLDSGNWLANYGLGTWYLQHGRYAEAVEMLRATVRLEPSDAEAHNDLGVALLQTGDREGALQSFRTAVRLQPDLARARFNLARVQSGAAHDVEMEGLRLALSGDPDDAEAHRRLAEALVRRARVREAAQQYQEVLRIVPGDASALRRLAEIGAAAVPAP